MELLCSGIEVAHAVIDPVPLGRVSSMAGPVLRDSGEVRSKRRVLPPVPVPMTTRRSATPVATALVEVDSRAIKR